MKLTSETIELAYKGFLEAVRRHCDPPESEWLFYKENMHPRWIPEGEFFLSPGEPSNTFAYIHAGIMKQFFVTETGRESITRFDCPGDTSGDAATLWKGQAARQYVRAVTDVVALVATPGLLPKLRARSPVWIEGGRTLAEKRFFEKCDREFELLALNAEQRYERFLERHGTYAYRIPQKDAASYLGVTPSSLNKIIKRRKKLS